MMGAWVRFAKTGDPNGEGVSWPPYDAKQDPCLVFGDAASIQHGYRTSYLDFVADFLGSRATAP